MEFHCTLCSFDLTGQAKVHLQFYSSMASDECMPLVHTCSVSLCLGELLLGCPISDCPSKKVGASTHCRGDLPFLSGASTEAPAVRRSLIKSGLASYAAMCIGLMY